MTTASRAEASARFDLSEAFEILGRTPGVLSHLLRGVSGAWIIADEGHGTWCARDVVAHLLYGEQTDWIVRARQIFGGGTPTFEPFDRQGHRGTSADASLSRLIDEFAGCRHENLQELTEMRLDEEQLDMAGVHPDLGEVTLRELIAAWVVHDLHHIGQISRAMAKRYDDAVGPWKAYMSILTR
jgi:uncharacterized damage-inducible protein DinB